MNWVTVIWSMSAAACLTLAVVYILVWFQRRSQWGYLLFSLAAIGTAGLTFFEAWALKAATVAEYGMVLRWGHLPFWIMVLSMVGFVRVYLRAGRLWLAWTICGLRTLSLILNFIFFPNINFREITALRHVRFLGESVSAAVGIPNPWMLTGQISIVLFLVYLVDATFTMWRRGERWSMLLLSSGMTLFVATALGQYILGFWGISPTVLTSSPYFLAVVAVMAWEMSRETIRAEQLSEDLNKRDEWLDMTADSAGVGLWMWDFKTNAIWTTERARKLYGISSGDQIPFERFVAALHPDDMDWVLAAAQKSMETGTDFRDDYRIVLPDGTVRWIRAMAKTFFSPDGLPEHMSGVSLDFTEHRQMELALQQKHDELAHVTRVSIVSKLASSLAHELNQPLGAILRNAEAAELFLQNPSPDLGELRAIMADIRQDDQRAGAVIDRMRTLMKQREVEKHCLDLNLLTAEVISLVRSDADKRHVRLELDFDTALPPVYGDQVQLQQVVINLVVNAMDALDETLSEERLVTVSVRPVGLEAEIAVSDNGPGIAPDRLQRIFEPFFSSKTNGLGMGLAISRSIVEAHGGLLWAENNETGGATFVMSLPSVEGEIPS